MRLSIAPLALAVLAAAVLVVAVSPSAARADDCAPFQLDCGDAPSGSERRCGRLADGDAPRRIRATAVGCRLARDVAKAQWLRSGRFDDCAPRRRACRVRGYRCAWRGNDVVRCRDGARRVRFAYAR